MPVASKRGMDELCFSVLLSLTFGWSETTEKLMCDAGDKSRGNREYNSYLLTCGKPKQKSVYF